MDVEPLAIPDVKRIRLRRFNDARGFFQQTYNSEEYAAAGISIRFVQDNWSRTRRGVLRGLHYQYEYPQEKLVAVLRGEIFDVAVDLRRSSPTFGRWVGTVINAESGEQLYIPAGFAHGFLALSETVDLVYKCSDFYAPGDECGIRWNDPTIGVEWPVTTALIISEKDETLGTFVDAKLFE